MISLKLYILIGIIGLTYGFLAISAVFFGSINEVIILAMTGILMIPLGFIAERLEAKNV